MGFLDDALNAASLGAYGTVEDLVNDDNDNPELGFLKGTGNVITVGASDELLGTTGTPLGVEPNDDPTDPNSPDYDPAFRTDIPKPSDPSGPVANPK